MTGLFTFKKRTITFLLPFVALSAWLILSVSHDQRQVLLPVLTAVAVTGLLIVKVWTRTGVVPLFDIGCIATLATLIYTIIPPLQYLLSGLQHTFLSAFQLYALAPTPEEMGAFTWRYTVYLASLAAGYIALPDSPGIRAADPVPNPGNTRVLVRIYLLLLGFIYAFKVLYGVDPNVVYDDELLSQAYSAMKAMPLFLQQIYNKIFSILFLVKLSLMLTLFIQWKKRSCRLILYAWLAFMLISYIFKMGARTELVLTFFAAIIMYHRFVRPLGVAKIVTAGGTIFAGFLFFGAIRGQTSLGANVENLQTLKEYSEIIFSLGTEFQTLFAGTYDLFWMKEHGIIENVPLQFLFYDVVMLIPQQLLPFAKIDIQDWYTGLSMNPSFFMYNSVAQSVLGFGWAELIARGALLGLSFAELRRWYLRNGNNFWKTLLYSYLIVESYTTARSTPFFNVFFLVGYVFVPLYFLVRLLANFRRVKPKPGSALSSIANT